MLDNKAEYECRIINYEKEYYRLNELVKRLENENAELKETIVGLCKSAFVKRGADNG